MLKLMKFFACIMLIAIFFTSPIFATDLAVTSEEDIMLISEESTVPTLSNTINNDLFVNEDSDYTFDAILYGNAFISANNLTLNSRNNGRNYIRGFVCFYHKYYYYL